MEHVFECHQPHESSESLQSSFFALLSPKDESKFEKDAFSNGILPNYVSIQYFRGKIFPPNTKLKDLTTEIKESVNETRFI